MSKIQKTEKFVPMEVAGEVMKLEKLKKEIDTRLKTYKAQLLDVMKQTGVKSLKTDDYILYRTDYEYVKINDHARAIEDLQNKEIPIQTEEVLASSMKATLDELVKKQKQEVDGIELARREYVGVRLNEEKK